MARWRQGCFTATDVDERLTFMLCGRAAEEVLLGRVSSGAGGGSDSDLASAASALCECGLDPDYGLLWSSLPRDDEVRIMLAADRRLARFVRERLAHAYDSAVSLLSRHQVAAEALVDVLIERGALSGSQAFDVLRSATTRPRSRR